MARRGTRGVPCATLEHGVGGRALRAASGPPCGDCLVQSTCRWHWASVPGREKHGASEASGKRPRVFVPRAKCPLYPQKTRLHLRRPLSPAVAWLLWALVLLQLVALTALAVTVSPPPRST